MSTRKVVKFENINLLETRLENRLEIVSDVVVVDSTVKQSVEKEYVVEARSSPVEKNEAGSHQKEKTEARIQKRKRLEEKDEESPRRKKFGRGGDSVSDFGQKCETNRAGGGGSNVKNLLAKFGNMAKETLYERGGVRHVNTILERAKAVPGCAGQRGKFCSKPMAESLQSKVCE